MPPTHTRRIVICGAAVAALAGVGANDTGTQANRLPSSVVVTLPADITSLAAINGNSRVLAGMADGRIAVWNTRDETPAVLTAHQARILAIGSSFDGSEAWSLAVDGSLARTRLAPGSQTSSRSIDLGPEPARAVAFAADGSMVVVGGEFGGIRVYDTGSGKLRQQFRGHSTELQAVAVRPGSPIVASASAEADLRIWDAAAGREIGFVDGDLSLFALGFSPRDGRLATGGVDRRLTLRDPVTFRPVGELALKAPRMVASIAWSPDGRLIAVGDIDDETLSKGGLQVVDAASRAVVAHLETGGAPVGTMTFVHDPRTLVGAVGRGLRAWKLTGIE